jgi:hypothetical protein
LTPYTGVRVIFFLVKICYLPARFARRGIISSTKDELIASKQITLLLPLLAFIFFLEIFLNHLQKTYLSSLSFAVFIRVLKVGFSFLGLKFFFHMGLHYEFPGKNIGVAKVNHGYSQYYDIL